MTRTIRKIRLISSNMYKSMFATLVTAHPHSKEIKMY